MLQAALDAGKESRLPRVMTALSRPTRIVRGKEVDAAWTVDAGLFEFPEEGALQQAQQAAASRISRDMPLDEFLEVRPVSAQVIPSDLRDSLHASPIHVAGLKRLPFNTHPYRVLQPCVTSMSMKMVNLEQQWFQVLANARHKLLIWAQVCFSSALWYGLSLTFCHPQGNGVCALLVGLAAMALLLGSSMMKAVCGLSLLKRCPNAFFAFEGPESMRFKMYNGWRCSRLHSEGGSVTVSHNCHMPWAS